MAIDLFFYLSYKPLFLWNIIRYMATNSPAFTSFSARGIAIWGNCYLVYLIGGMEIFGRNMFFLKRK